ncbi:hypothetical protein K492DRAFT_207665 [Lichtheimia hyalospora FSU 10163]|nr:hypothetical protein K492DRAFT_207665 [Lichtheimia hyalospora FSU 10163]
MNDNPNQPDKPNALTTPFKGLNAPVSFTFKPKPARKLVSWGSLPRVEKESSNNDKATHHGNRKPHQENRGDNIIARATTSAQSNQRQLNHAAHKQGSSFWFNASTGATAKPTSSTTPLRSQATTPSPSLFSFAPSFQSNAQNHPAAPLSTAVQMLPASASTQFEKSSIKKKRHDNENNSGTRLVRVKKEKPTFNPFKFKSVSFAVSPSPASNESCTTQPSSSDKSTIENIPSRTISTLPSSTAFNSDDPVILASPTTTTTPLTDNRPARTIPMTDITNTISHKSNERIKDPNSSMKAAPYTHQHLRPKFNSLSSVNGEQGKKEATTTTNPSNQFHMQDVDKFALFLKQTLAQKDAARTAAVEEINTLRGKMQAQEKIISEYKSQFERLDQVSTSLSSKQDDMGQGIHQLSSEYTLVKSMLEDLKRMVDNLQQSAPSMDQTNTLTQFQELIAKTTKLQDEQRQMTIQHMSNLEKAISRNSTMSDRLYALYTDVKGLRNKINHAIETSTKQRAYIAGTMNTIVDLETARISELRKEASTLHVDMNALSEHFSHIGHTIQSSKQASDLVKRKIGCIREKIACLEDMMNKEDVTYVHASNPAGMSIFENRSSTHDADLENLRSMVQHAQAEAARQAKIADDSAADGMRLLSEVAFLKAELETQKDRYDVLQESYDKREQEQNAADSGKMILRSTYKKRLNPDPILAPEPTNRTHQPQNKLRRRKRNCILLSSQRILHPANKSQALPASNELTDLPGDIMDDIAVYIQNLNDKST